LYFSLFCTAVTECLLLGNGKIVVALKYKYNGEGFVKDLPGMQEKVGRLRSLSLSLSLPQTED
jgi:hypothetical protein